MKYICAKCGKQLDDYTAYEYRGAYSCEDHFEEVIEARDIERNQIIKEEESKLRPLKGLDLTSSIIGKANRKLMAKSIEISSKESERLKSYEGRN